MIEQRLLTPMNRLALAALAFLVTALVPAWGQIEDPVTWEFSLHPSETAGMHDVVFHASVDTCWHIYSQHLDDPNGPLPTWFSVELPQGAVGQGDVQECEPIVEYDPNFMMDLKYFEEEVYWWQTVDLSGASPNDSIRGFLSFMVCDERQCLPPEDIPFALAVSDVSATGRPDVCPPSQHLCHPEQAEEGEEVVQEEKEEEGLVGTFLLGFLLGLAALFTPCVFPMIPMTVSFFTKQSKNRADGIKNALLYGFFIIFIYTGLGLALTAFFGVDVLNVISTDPLFNVFLFALLLVLGRQEVGISAG